MVLFSFIDSTNKENIEIVFTAKLGFKKT